MFSNLEVKAYIVNLRDYNNGIITGGWVDLPQEEEEISELIYNLTDEGKYDYEILDIDCNQEVGIDLYDNYRFDLAGLNELVDELIWLDLDEWELLDFGKDSYTWVYHMDELGEYLQTRFEKDPEGAFNLGFFSKANFSYIDPYFEEDGYGNLVSLTEDEYQDILKILLERYINDYLN